MAITIRTDFGTDSGPPCEVSTCKGTIYAYQVPAEGNVTVQCVGCHAYDYLPMTDVQPVTAAECAALHRTQRAERDRQNGAQAWCMNCQCHHHTGLHTSGWR
jgi:hypothetical protein